MPLETVEHVQFVEHVINDALDAVKADLGNPVEKYAVAITEKLIDRWLERVAAKLAAQPATPAPAVSAPAAAA